MIELIAGQLDRHMGNYLIKVDGQGRVEKVTGIDLDQSFSSDMVSTDCLLMGGHYLGLPTLFDREFAQRVLAVTAEQLRAVLAPCSSPSRFRPRSGACSRCSPRSASAGNTHKLVERDGWNEDTRRQQVDEKTSYLGRLRTQVFAHEYRAEVASTLLAGSPAWRDFETEKLLGSRLLADPNFRPAHVRSIVRHVDQAMRTAPAWQPLLRANEAIGREETTLSALHLEKVHVEDHRGSPEEIARLGDRHQALLTSPSAAALRAAATHEQMDPRRGGAHLGLGRGEPAADTRRNYGSSTGTRGAAQHRPTARELEPRIGTGTARRAPPAAGSAARARPGRTNLN